jgi:hypothetical protein
MEFKIPLLLIIIFLTVLPVRAEEKEPEIPPAVLEKMEQLQKGELNQLEKIKLADELQRAGAKPEALALYEENLPIDHLKSNIPPEAYLNYGTALLEKGEEQKGLAVYETLADELDPKSPQTQKIKDIIEKNVVNFFQVQEQKKQQEKKDKEDKEKKENKENKEKGDKDQQQGSGQDPKDQKGEQGQNPKDQKDKKDQGDKSQDKQDKKDEKGEEKDKEQKDKEDKEKDGENKEKDPKDKGESDKEGEEKKMPPPKMTPKLKQLMSDDRQLQLKVIEQGTRDMNRRTNRDNKDW